MARSPQIAAFGIAIALANYHAAFWKHGASRHKEPALEIGVIAATWLERALRANIIDQEVPADGSR